MLGIGRLLDQAPAVAQDPSARKPFGNFEIWKKTASLRDWSISYKKGLAALEDEEYCDIIRNPKMFALVPGENLRRSLDDWFGSDPGIRKQKILGGGE